MVIIMNKKDNNILEFILELEKNFALDYFYFLNETSNDYLYENIFSMMEDSSDMSREIYNTLYKNGIIKINSIDSLKNNKKIEELETYLKEINGLDIE